LKHLVQAAFFAGKRLQKFNSCAARAIMEDQRSMESILRELRETSPMVTARKVALIRARRCRKTSRERYESRGLARRAEGD
jgi:hypothetical protein